jgi:transposase
VIAAAVLFNDDRKQLRRSHAVPVGMEACATANWAHELTKLGHRVPLMPAKDVKAYVECNKKRKNPRFVCTRTCRLRDRSRCLAVRAPQVD